jgi:hypothetical protein
MPDIQPNFVAVAVAVVLNFLLGYAWYTPLFGRIWARELGLPADRPTPGTALATGLFANVAGCFLVAVVLSNNIAAWTPRTWGIQGEDLAPLSQGLQAAIFTWLGFFVPPLLNGLAWEKRGWKLTGIHGGYHLASLLVAGLVITHMR